MCLWGTEILCKVNICKEDSHTGKPRWDYKLIDSCISDIVNALNNAGILTRNCCCGHNKSEGVIILQDGRSLIIKN